ncbi:MAG: tetratricopeptide repeat protein [Acidobacteria bacterium]|nr:tetratricopeptide repeat protein [Acidobacteriota bacterium]
MLKKGWAANMTGLNMVLVLCVCVAMPVCAQVSKTAKKSPQANEANNQVKAAGIFEEGQNAHQAGDLNKAIDLYSQALKLDPMLWQAEFQKGNAYLSLKKCEEAKRSMVGAREMLSQFADSVDLRNIMVRINLMLGEIALAESKSDEAELAFRRAIELNPQSGRAHLSLAELLFTKGSYEEAVSEAKIAISNGEDGSGVYSMVGAGLVKSGKIEDATSYLHEALKRDPRSLVALNYRVEAMIAKKRFQDAITDLRASLAVDPRIQTKMRLAAVLSAIGGNDEAMKIYQEVLRTDPENTEARTAITSITIESGKGAEAIEQLEVLIKSQPERADLKAQLGDLYLAKQPEKALEQYAAASKIDPSNVKHLIGIGSALVKLRRFQDAVQTLRGVLSGAIKDDTAYFAHTNLGAALFELDDFPGAAKEFVWILNYQSSHNDLKKIPVTLYFLGICFDKLGDYPQALKVYQQFLTMASSDNQLEIEKVKLRLPSLQRQIKEGKGKKK